MNLRFPGPAIRRAGVVLAFAALYGAAPAAAKAPPPKAPSPPQILPRLEPRNAAAARHLARERAADALVGQAINEVMDARPHCRPSVPHPAATVTHDAPSQPVLDAIAALRRPAADADRLPGTGTHPPSFAFGELYADFTRSVTTASGKSFYLTVARTVRPVFHLSAACLSAEHARLVVRVRGVDGAVRSLALKRFAVHRQEQKQLAALPAGPQDAIFLFAKGEGGAGIGYGGGGGDIASFREQGTFIGSGGSRPEATFSGAVPDGVAAVTLEYPKVAGRGPWYKPTVYPSAYRTTVEVRENVLSVRVPRWGIDAFSPRMLWLDAAGNVIHVHDGGPPR